MRQSVRSAPAWRRLVISYHVLKPVQSRYVAVYEDPWQPDAPAAVLLPAPEWMAAALHGGILPPLDAVLRDQERSFAWGDRPESWDAPPIGPLTEEQAIEYCVMMSVPRHVWDAPPGNRRRLVICTADQIPTDRSLRDAWSIAA